MNATFGRAEISYLIERPRFRAGLVETLTIEDFEGLRKLALELLSERPDANPAARSLHQYSKHDSQRPLPLQG